MPNDRRAFVPGGCFFFAINLLERKQTLVFDHIASLREAVATTWADITPSRQTHSSCCQIIRMRSGPCHRGIAMCRRAGG
jgi:REP element-mobilizing transposase RayT